MDVGKINPKIKWTLKHDVSVYKDNSVSNSSDIFKAMFPDSNIASMMKLDRKKLRFVINFGIATFLQDILKEEVASSEWFNACFDESLNNTIQECEMYLVIRYWDDVNDKVQVRF